MNNDSNEFARLQKLLALKKYEKPPPRFFQDFSDKVIARIQDAEEERARPWWQKLGLDFVLRPAFAGAMGLMLSAGLVMGIVLADPQNSAQTPPMQPSIHIVGFEPAGSASIRTEDIPSSTAPVATVLAGATPFSKIGLSAQRVNWMVSQ